MTRYVILGLVAAATAAAGLAHAQDAAAPPAAAAPAPPPAPPAPLPAPAVAPAAISPYLLAAIDKVCLPLIQGQKIKDVAQANGLRRSRDDWALQGPGVERVIITIPSVANPTVCSMSVNYEVGQTDGVVAVLNNWATAHNPPLAVLSAGYAANPGVTGWSWELDTPAQHVGLVFNAQKGADGKPVGKTFEVGTLLFSARGG